MPRRAPVLNARWAGEIDDASIFGLRVFPEASSRPAAWTALLAAIAAVNSYLIGVSRSAAGRGAFKLLGSGLVNPTKI